MYVNIILTVAWIIFDLSRLEFREAPLSTNAFSPRFFLARVILREIEKTTCNIGEDARRLEKNRVSLFGQGNITRRSCGSPSR